MPADAVVEFAEVSALPCELGRLLRSLLESSEEAPRNLVKSPGDALYCLGLGAVAAKARHNSGLFVGGVLSSLAVHTKT
jgi:hypothetical protein